MGGSYTKPEVASRYYEEYTSKLPSLKGKVAAITGTTSGTGLVCAKALAKQGAHVLLLNRVSERSVSSEREILESVPGAKVTSIECDLQSFDSVRKAAAIIKGQVNSLDILCNNAGVMALADVATPDGYDVQMQTNHLSHFLLTRELFPLLEKASEMNGEARVVNHSSGARKYPAGDLGSQYLDKLTAKGSKVKALCATPGLSATNLQVTSNKEGGFLSTWMMFLAQSAEDGALPLITCCASPEASGGELWEPASQIWGPPKKFPFDSPLCTSEEQKTLLWVESERAVGPWAL